MNGGVVVAVALLLASAFGFWRRYSDGKARVVAAVDVVAPADLGVPALGARATILQFSSSFCAPCRATRLIAEDIAAHDPEVLHVDINAEERLDLVARWDIRRTPTVLVLDRAGAVVARVTGQPRRVDLLAAVAHPANTPVLGDQGRNSG